jgi:hypothetical protein
MYFVFFSWAISCRNVALSPSVLELFSCMLGTTIKATRSARTVPSLSSSLRTRSGRVCPTAPISPPHTRATVNLFLSIFDGIARLMARYPIRCTLRFFLFRSIDVGITATGQLYSDSQCQTFEKSFPVAQQCGLSQLNGAPAYSDTICYQTSVPPPPPPPGTGSTNSAGKLGAGAIAGIVIGSVAGVGLLAGGGYFYLVSAKAAAKGAESVVFQQTDTFGVASMTGAVPKA